jgi:hypothetical protein
MANIQDFRVRKGLIVSENATVSGTSTLTGNTTISGFANVGSTLQVSGTSTLTGNTTFGGFASVGGALQVVGVAAFGGSNVTFDTDTLLIDATNDRVGVNTAFGQTVAFMVTGDANVTGTFTTANLQFTNANGTSLTVGTGNSQFDSGVLFIDAVNNRVGINNTTPDAALTVTGSANVSGAMRVSGSFNGVLAASFSNTLSIAGNTSIGERLTVTGSATLSNTISVTGNATFSNTLAVTGLITATGGVTGDLNGTANQCARSVLAGTYMTGGGALTSNITLTVDATSAATASKVVARDTAGSFSANVITASLSGTATGANTLLYASAQRSATDAATASSIVARDSSGNFSANVITATATSARYADLAEKYTTDKEYIPGTVVVIADDSIEAECIASDYISQVAIGVISTNPAYLMNAESEGQPVALKGRVPVRVVGPIRKGQTVVAGINGCATVGNVNPIAVALQTNSSHEEKLVECFII